MHTPGEISWPAALEPSIERKVKEAWNLRPELKYLNHGSFGACPRAVLRRQQDLRLELEQNPIHFMERRHLGLLDASRECLSAFVDCDPAGLVFVTNATTAVSTVLWSLEFAPGDELLTTDHVYGACKIALERRAQQCGAILQIAPVPLSSQSESEFIQSILSAVTPRTKFVLLDHVASSTSLIFPLNALVHELKSRGIWVMIDGAHAPGMLDVSIKNVQANFYTGNCHKWICAPKGAAFLWVEPSFRESIFPLVTSYGAAIPAPKRSVYHRRFDWTGTHDPTPFICVADAIEFMGSFLPGAWDALRARNHAMVCAAQSAILSKIGETALFSDELLGSMATIVLPKIDESPTRDVQYDRHGPWYPFFRSRGFEVPVFKLSDGRRALRISAQIYNEPSQYLELADAILEFLADTKNKGRV